MGAGHGIPKICGSVRGVGKLANGSPFKVSAGPLLLPRRTGTDPGSLIERSLARALSALMHRAEPELMALHKITALVLRLLSQKRERSDVHR
jgi:hypothetical protein